MHPVIDHTKTEHNIRELQTMLRGLSYADPTLPRPAVTGVSDGLTEAAVRAFQQSTGLEETGRADLETWTALVGTHEKAVRRYLPAAPLYPAVGDIFFEMPPPKQFILLLQVLLTTLSAVTEVIPAVLVNGVYGESTARAVAAVQSLTDIPADGLLNGATWDALAALYNLEAKKLSSSPPIKQP